MADKIAVRNSEGVEYDIPTSDLQLAVSKGFTPVESKGPLRQAVDSAISSYQNAARNAKEGVGEVVRRVTSPNWVNQETLTNAISPPQSATGAAIQGAMVAASPFRAATRIAAPIAAGAAVGTVEGKGPLMGGLEATAPVVGGELTAGLTNMGLRLHAQRATQRAAESASVRESGKVSDALTDIAPDTSMYLKGRTAQELMDLRDPGAITKFAKQQLDTAEGNIGRAFQGQTWGTLVGHTLAPNPYANYTMPEIVDLLKTLKAQSRLVQDSAQPAARYEAIRAADQLEAEFRRIVGNRDPQLLADRDLATGNYGKLMTLLDAVKAGTSKPGTNREVLLDSEGMRKYIQRNREDYPAETYQPLLDALQVGKGTVTHNVNLPLLPFGRIGNLGVGSTRVGFGTAARPGAPPAPQVSPSLYDLFAQKILGTLNPQ